MVTTPQQLSLLRQAAVLGTFDPEHLLNSSSQKQKEEDLAFLAQHSTEKQVGNVWRWTLLSDARQTGLKELPAGFQERERFLDDNKPDGDDVLGAMLYRALRVKPDAVAKRLISSGKLEGSVASTEHRLIFFQAIELLLAAGIPLPEWVAPMARSLRRSILMTNRTLGDASFRQDPFRGRGREQRFLQDFANRGAAAISAAARAPFPGLRILTTKMGPDMISAVAIGGIGGSGKSALLNVVRRSLDNKPNSTIIMADFDQPSLRAGSPGALMLEFTRQLALVEPDLDNFLSTTRRNLRQRLGLGHASSGEYEISSSAFFELFSDLQGILTGNQRLRQPLVFIMDTFEEVLVASAARLLTLSDVLNGLREQVGFTEIRLILAGRAIEKALDVPGQSQIAIGSIVQLGELGKRAGKAKLSDMFRRLGIDHLELVSGLIDVFGSNPLVIEILASYCTGKDRQEIDDLIVSGKAERAKGLNEEMAHTFLYSRILERIGDPELQRLAHPGLVLRRVMPELIRDVLAGPCELGENLDISRAEELLDKLRAQVWLVDSDGDRQLVHRRDLRRLMLPLILQKPGALEVTRLAAAWYLRQPQDGSNELESLYYQALGGGGVQDQPVGVLRALSDHLGLDVDDLPMAARALVKNADRRSLTANEVQSLPEDQRLRYESRRQRRILAEGLESVSVEGAGYLPQTASVVNVSASRVGEPNVEVPKTTEDIQTDFTRCNFTLAASSGGSELRSTLMGLAIPRSVESRYTIDHAGYIGVLASNDTERLALRKRVEELLSTFERNRTIETLRSSLSQELGLALEGEGVAVAPLIAFRALAIDPMKILDQRWSDRASKNFEEPPVGRPPQATAAMRVAMALRHCHGSPPEVRLSLLHTFDPWLIDQLGNLNGSSQTVRFDFSGGSNEMISQYDHLRSLGRSIRVTDLNKAEDLAARISVVIPIDGLSDQRLVVGRAPEFYGPARHALLQVENQAALADAVADIASAIPLWPSDLSPDAFRDRTRLTPIVASLVDIADRYGQLETLLNAVNSHTGGDATIASVMSRYRSFRRAWSEPLHRSPGDGR